MDARERNPGESGSYARGHPWRPGFRLDSSFAVGPGKKGPGTQGTNIQDSFRGITRASGGRSGRSDHPQDARSQLPVLTPRLENLRESEKAPENLEPRTSFM
eukprot:7289954-Pyramimonas_sp.AAC.1